MQPAAPELASTGNLCCLLPAECGFAASADDEETAAPTPHTPALAPPLYDVEAEVCMAAAGDGHLCACARQQAQAAHSLTDVRACNRHARDACVRADIARMVVPQLQQQPAAR